MWGKEGQRLMSGASFINKVPRTNLKSVLGPFLGRALVGFIKASKNRPTT